MGKGRDKRKKKETQLSSNKAAHQARVNKIAELKAKKQGKTLAPSVGDANDGRWGRSD